MIWEFVSYLYDLGHYSVHRLERDRRGRMLDAVVSAPWIVCQFARAATSWHCIPDTPFKVCFRGSWTHRPNMKARFGKHCISDTYSMIVLRYEVKSKIAAGPKLLIQLSACKQSNMQLSTFFKLWAQTHLGIQISCLTLNCTHCKLFSFWTLWSGAWTYIKFKPSHACKWLVKCWFHDTFLRRDSNIIIAA